MEPSITCYHLLEGYSRFCASDLAKLVLRVRLSESEAAIQQLNLLGGILCLDFVNTVDWRARLQPVEYLHQYHDLLVWGRYVDIVEDSQAQVLMRGAASDA